MKNGTLQNLLQTTKFQFVVLPEKSLEWCTLVKSARRCNKCHSSPLSRTSSHNILNEKRKQAS